MEYFTNSTMDIIFFLMVNFKLCDSGYVYQRKYNQVHHGKFYKVLDKVMETPKFYEIDAENEQECVRKCNQDSENCKAINLLRGSNNNVKCRMLIGTGQVQEMTGTWYITRTQPVTYIIIYFKFAGLNLLGLINHTIRILVLTDLCIVKG